MTPPVGNKYVSAFVEWSMFQTATWSAGSENRPTNGVYGKQQFIGLLTKADIQYKIRTSAFKAGYWFGFLIWGYYRPSCQKATALAAATLRESTPWDMGILTV